MPLLVLMADDDPSTCSLVKDFLEMQGYAVITANNGQEAMALLSTYHPHLLISDVKMPKQDGYHLLWELRQRPEFRLLPVILLTECDQPEQRIQGYQMGCDAYLPKPFNLLELLAIARNLLERSQVIQNELRFQREERPLSPQAGDADIPEQIREAMDQSMLAHLESLNLTQRELEVLDVLIQGFSNVAIGQHLHLSPRTVEKYVSNLLRKTRTNNRAELVGFALKYHRKDG
ncbi:response regulator transcription factor [Synechocystis sp. LKSZ1]|uniref:response regulator transcription factor n=1 Tax=Synechocystis sp. LKSZ1 TaxID=3144951 RepID=UPI00336BBEF8